MLGKFFPLIAIAAVGYWYWSGPYQERGDTAYAKQLEENTRVMKRCMRREETMTAGAGMAGASMESGDSQAYCAEQNGLTLRDGEWHRIGE